MSLFKCNLCRCCLSLYVLSLCLYLGVISMFLCRYHLCVYLGDCDILRKVVRIPDLESHGFIVEVMENVLLNFLFILPLS